MNLLAERYHLLGAQFLLDYGTVRVLQYSTELGPKGVASLSLASETNLEDGEGSVQWRTVTAVRLPVQLSSAAVSGGRHDRQERVGDGEEHDVCSGRCDAAMTAFSVSSLWGTPPASCSSRPEC